MTILIYDGSFEGLFTAIYECYINKIPFYKIVPKNKIQQNFFEEYKFIETDLIKAEKLQKKIISNISQKALHKIYYVFISEIDNKEELICSFLKLGFEFKKETHQYLSNKIVLTVNRISQKVLKEKHLLLGLIRFRELKNNIFYAPIEPKYNILILLTPHFVKRMPLQNWIIHDTKRKIAAIYNQKGLLLIELDTAISTFSDQEEKFQSLWKEYFENIKIEDRVKPKLQKQHMPLRYWKYLIEKSL